jgi:hypothetical protein
MDICRRETPTLRLLADRRAVACHLDADAPPLPEGNLAPVLA